MKFAFSLFLVPTILLLCNRSFQDLQFTDLYDDLRLITKDGDKPVKISMDNDKNFTLRLNRLSEDEFFVVLEYDFDQEGVICIIKEEDEKDDPEFLFKADYILKGVPFILNTIFLDRKEKEHEFFIELFEEGFGESEEIVGKDKILEIINDGDIIEMNLDKFHELSITHRFISFELDIENPKMTFFSLSTETDEQLKFMGNQLNKFEIVKYTLEQITSYLDGVRDLVIANLIDGAKRDAQLDFPDKSSKEYIERNSEIVNYNGVLSTEITSHFEKYLKYLTDHFELIINYPGIDKDIEEANRLLDITKTSKVVFSAAMFYISKYLFFSGKSDIDPVQELHYMNDSIEHFSQIQMNFTDISTNVFDNLIGYLQKRYLEEGYNEKTDEFVDELRSLAEKHADELGLKESKELALHSIDREIDYHLGREHINERLLDISFQEQIMQKYIGFVKQQDPGIFMLEKYDLMVNKYFSLSLLMDMQNEPKEYEPLNENIFERIDDRKLILS
jgi:hypothetical protein